MLKKLQRMLNVSFFVALLIFGARFGQIYAEPNMLLRTNRIIYTLGEDVTIILTNNGNEQVGIGGYPAWQIFSYPEDKPVYPEVFAFLAWSLGPGESNTSIWPHKLITEIGTYVVKDTQGWKLSAAFVIVEPQLLGDVNNDGKVDMQDVGHICLSYGSYPSHPKWNSRSDVNCDEKVDMKDIGITIQHFGQTE